MALASPLSEALARLSSQVTGAAEFNQSSCSCSTAISSSSTMDESRLRLLESQVESMRAELGHFVSKVGQLASAGSVYTVSGSASARSDLETERKHLAALQSARERLEAMELKQLLVASEASKGLAHCALRATLRHARIHRLGQALASWAHAALVLTNHDAARRIETAIDAAARDAAALRVQLAARRREQRREKNDARAREAELQVRE